MNKFFDKPFAKFLRIFIAAAAVSGVLFAFFDKDAYKAIWVGCFLLVSYYFFDSQQQKNISEIQESGFFFDNRFNYVIVRSAILLIGTTILSIVLWVILVGDKYCEKGSFFYSERICAIEQAKEPFYGDYLDSE